MDNVCICESDLFTVTGAQHKQQNIVCASVLYLIAWEAKYQTILMYLVFVAFIFCGDCKNEITPDM